MPQPDPQLAIVQSHGAQVELEAPRAAIERLTDRLGRSVQVEAVGIRRPDLPSYVVSQRGNGNWYVDAPTEPMIVGSALPDVVDRLANRLHRDLPALAPDRIFIHAGVVAFDHCLVVLPGNSGSGKSTLVEALVRRGATYWSDEYLVVDREGRAHPYPRPIVLKGPEGRRHIDPDDLMGTVASESGSVSLVVFTHYAPNAEWRPDPITPARAGLALIEHTVHAQTLPAASTRAAADIARHAPMFRTLRPGAETTADLLEKLVLDHSATGRRSEDDV